MERKRKNRVVARYLAVVALLLNSCATFPAAVKRSEENTTTHYAGVSSPEFRDHWHLVTDSPPTFYPKGVPNSSSTSHKEGEWIVAANGKGKWFIPFQNVGSVPREQLMTEAWAWREKVDPDGKYAEMNQKERRAGGEVLSKIAFVSTVTGLLAVSVDRGGSPEMPWLAELWESLCQ